MGDPIARIIECTAEPGVDLVILTAHGRTSVPPGYLGHVAAGVAAQTRDPILLVRPEAALIHGLPSELRRLLFPLDGTPTTARAVAPLTRLAAQLGASVDLLYVAEPSAHAPAERGSVAGPPYEDQPQHEWPEWAEEWAERLGRICAECPPSVPLRVVSAVGEPAREIVRVSREGRYDAIALARRSHLEPGRASVLRGVLADATCPILLVGWPTP
jgi:nucleotide-binding universal stress UspA family protein